MPSSADHKSLKSPSSAQSTSSSLRHAQSVRSNRPPVPTISVITTPPWAQDEPPSPQDETPPDGGQHASESRPSDVASYRSSYLEAPGSSRWWTFNRQRQQSPLQYAVDGIIISTKPEKRGLKLRERSRSMSWLSHGANRRSADGTLLGQTIKENEKVRDKDVEGNPEANLTPPREHDWNIALPTPIVQPFTVSQNMTPGWGAPWSPGIPDAGLPHSLSRVGVARAVAEKNMTPWKRRRKRVRTFILTDPYVPLFFRFINISLTTAALGIAIRIRALERRNHVMGAIGSSPILVIIFAPLTLLHVMAAIYLEYFGRPLGLWRTSAKLAHTLSEVLFICAWSAALSLSFDNFSTSLIPCASPSSTSWFNEISRPPSLNLEHQIGHRLCHDQLALICLVGVGLIMYCTSLIISLFRIFEKVKYHRDPPIGTRS